MWLRRCGAPPFLPSKIKVLIQASIVGMFVYSVFTYLNNATVAMLSLEHPIHTRAHWVLAKEECRLSNDPVHCMYKEETHVLIANYLENELDDSCPIQPPEEAREECKRTAVPLAGVHLELRALAGFWSPFAIWRLLFLVLMVLITLSTVVHDVGLMTEFGRRRVSSLHMLAERRQFHGLLVPFWCCPPCMVAIRSRSCLLYSLLIPFQVLFQVFAFFIWAYPATLVMWILHPWKLSRLVVCYTSAVLILWAVVYLLFLLAFDFNEYVVIVENQVFYGDDALKYPYAAQYPYTDRATGCINICKFHLAGSVVWTLCFAAITVMIQGWSICFRAFKGLRRQEWASLFSVLYTVPIEAFPVMWTRPDGSPIKWRTGRENPALMAVQGEPAFDPFALMDEQPESARCRPLLMPIPRSHTRGYTTKQDAEIGCCGFPSLEDDTDEDKSSGEETVDSSYDHHLPVIVDDLKPLFHHRLPTKTAEGDEESQEYGDEDY